MTTQDTRELVEALEAFCALIQYTGSREAMSALQVADKLGRAALEKFRNEPRETVRALALVGPNGRVIANTAFTNESNAGFKGLGWPDAHEIEGAIRLGFRAAEVTISIPAAKKTEGA
jgi:hypothetical protein